MTKFSNLLIGAAGAAIALVGAAPAAAQAYPYPGQSQGGIGAILGTIFSGQAQGQYGQRGYNQYGQGNTQLAVQQCSRAAEQRLSAQYRGQGAYNGGYGNSYGGQGARVLGITSVEQKSKGRLRVTGVATSGQANTAYGYDPRQGGYANPYGGYQGQGGYQGAYQGAYQGQADLRFRCSVNARGQVTDLQFDRGVAAERRGY